MDAVFWVFVVVVLFSKSWWFWREVEEEREKSTMKNLGILFCFLILIVQVFCEAADYC